MCARARLWPAAGTRGVPHDGWREELGKGAVCGRKHGLLGYGGGCEQSANFFCGGVATGKSYLWPKERRAGQRIISIYRRRRGVGAVGGARPPQAPRTGGLGAVGATG